MSAVNPVGNVGHHADDGASIDRPRRLSTETKAAFKTTEFFSYIAAVVAVLIASMVVGDDEGQPTRRGCTS